MYDLIDGKDVLIVGHADADGHLATEQSRRNILDSGARSCRAFVDRKVTAGYRMWRNYLPDIPINGADTVLFVDLMLHPSDPGDSVRALASLAVDCPDKTFIVIDHHPMLGLPALPDNAGIWFSPAVYTCCFGEPDWMMVVAAICDADEGPVAPMVNATMRHLALGVQRAAADSMLSGDSLLRLLENDRWDIIEAIADEPPEFHRRARGRRVANQLPSKALRLAHAAIN